MMRMRWIALQLADHSVEARRGGRRRGGFVGSQAIRAVGSRDHHHGRRRLGRRRRRGHSMEAVDERGGGIIIRDHNKDKGHVIGLERWMGYTMTAMILTSMQSSAQPIHQPLNIRICIGFGYLQ